MSDTTTTATATTDNTDLAPDELADLDLADPALHLRPDMLAVWEQLRAVAPVHWTRPREGRPGFWSVTRYDDAIAAYRNPALTSERGNVLSTLQQGHDSAAGKMLAVTDGPRHRAVRGVMLQSFSPRALAPIVAGVEQRVRDLVAGAVALGDCDFATDVADHIPINTIGDLMEVPRADRAKLVEWNTLTLARPDGEHDLLDEQIARNEILLYFGELARARRRRPGSDVLSALVTATIDGEPLSEEEIVFNCYSLILGADESSRMSAICAVLALAANPDQWRALKDGTVGLAEATEEVLRIAAPAMHFGRRAGADTEIGGQPVAAGDIVAIWNISANNDGAVFPEPHGFRLDRTPNRHVSFGHGAHFCLGSFLGRTHVSAVLEALRDQVDSIEQLGQPQRLISNFVFGYTAAPVRLLPARP